MSHTMIYRDSFENMLLVTITGNLRRDTRSNAIISERILHENQQWQHAATYDEENKTYIVFTKNACSGFKSAGNSFYSLSARGEEFCLTCGVDRDKHSTARFPVYC